MHDLAAPREMRPHGQRGDREWIVMALVQQTADSRASATEVLIRQQNANWPSVSGSLVKAAMTENMINTRIRGS
jgi:hypothetical protein